MSNTENLFRPTGYLRPVGVAEAVKLLAEYAEKAQLIAGGTDVLVERDPQVEVLIDITGVGLDYIDSDGQGVKIGAASIFADIAVSPALCKSPYDILAEAARQMGTPQVRNLATIGGNICSAVPSADSAPALLALDATLGIIGPTGERSMSIANFFQDVRKNALDRGELLTEIQLPMFPAHTGVAFIKKGRVATGDLAIVNIAVRITMATDNTCEEVRIALGAVAPTPLRVKQAEAMLQGQQLQDEVIGKVAAQAAREIKPISDVRSSAEYRRTLSRVLVERAIKEVVAKVSM